MSFTPTPPGPSAANRNFPSEHGQAFQILARYKNEGGVQVNLDILPHVTEEAYLDANPAARPARAFMIMCSEGDVSGIVELLQTTQEDYEEGEPVMPPAQLLRYQDPLDGMKSALHLAIEKGQLEVAWLLLWLASDLPDEQFPAEVIHAASGMNAQRASGTDEIDIRSLRDEQGQNAEDLAKTVGGPWNSLVQSEILFK